MVRLSQSLSLEGTSGRHLVQISFTDQGQLEQVLSNVSIGF